MRFTLGDDFDIPGGYGSGTSIDYAALDASLANASIPYALDVSGGNNSYLQLPGQRQGSNAGLSTLTSLLNATTSRLVALPGQTSLQPGQTLTVGPGGTYQISAAGQAPGLTAGANLGGLSLPMLLLLGVGAVVLMRGK